MLAEELVARLPHSEAVGDRIKRAGHANRVAMGSREARLKFSVRPRASVEPLDFGDFATEASLSVGIESLPPALLGSVFVAARKGLGYWDFVDLAKDRGRVVVGQPGKRMFQATIWCELPLLALEIKALCEELFQTGVLVMNPETGEVV